MLWTLFGDLAGTWIVALLFAGTETFNSKTPLVFAQLTAIGPRTVWMLAFTKDSDLGTNGLMKKCPNPGCCSSVWMPARLR